MPSVSATPVFTNYLSNGVNSDANFSAQATMTIGNVFVDVTNNLNRGTLQFDIPALLALLPAGALITAVRLVLKASGGAVQTGDKTYTCKRITRSGATIIGSLHDWDTFNGTNPWTTAGGDRTATHADSWTGGAMDDMEFNLLRQITDDAIAAPDDLLTLLLEGPEGVGSSQFKTPYSASAADPDNWPRLYFDYVVASNNLTSEEADALQGAWDNALQTTNAGSTAQHTNTTNLSLPRLRLMDLVAACPTFRAIVGAGSSAAAMAHIHSPHTTDTIDAETGRVTPTRPRAIVNSHEFLRNKLGTGYGASEGSLILALEVPPPPAADGDPNKELSAAEQLFGQILDEMEARCGQDKVSGEGVYSDEGDTHLNHTRETVWSGVASNFGEEDSGKLYYGIVLIVEFR